MTSHMHCRPCCGTNSLNCPSSFFFIHPGYATSSNYQSYIYPSYHTHDQAISAPPPPPPPAAAVAPSRRRRLEDPIRTYATNYYATLPRHISQSPPRQSLQPPPLPPARRSHQQPDRNGMYCDLFNLLERPSPPSPPLIKQRRKPQSNDYSPRRQHRPLDLENVHTKLKNTNDRKRYHQQSSLYKEKKRHEDKLSSTDQYDRSPEKTKNNNDIYRRRSSNKGFFRRVVGNYFCMPSTVANHGYSS